MTYKKKTSERVYTNGEVAKMEKNFQSFTSIVEKVKNDEVRVPLLKLCSELGDRLTVAPASTNLNYVGAYFGGLVQHSLRVTKLMKHLNDLFESGISADSLIITGLFHDIGKVGNLTQDYYLQQTSAWHQDKGIFFEINPEIPSMPVAQRSLWWLSQYKCMLTEEEITAIASMSDIGTSMTAANFYHQPMLAILLQTATRAACKQGTGKKGVLE